LIKLNLDKSIDRLSKRLNSLYPDDNNNGPGYWKGRKIIPKDQWLGMAHSISKGNKKYSVRDALRYFPDSYIEYVFPFGVPEHLKAEADKWYTYYIELMQHKKDPGYGSTKCHECLLCPQRDKFVLYIGIHKVIARGLEPKKKEGEEYPPIYPCPVVNRYECPYEREGRPNVNDLFEIQEIAHAVDMAFLKAYTITKSNDTVYDTDFVAGNVNETITLYNGSPHSWDTREPIEEKLPRVERLSVVPIRNVDDVYTALKDGDTLAKVLEQGLEEQYLSKKEFIIYMLMSIKDKIKKEDLRIVPSFTSNMKTTCMTCQGFANIHCINCSDVWLCSNHWKQHQVERHTPRY
jgi:hypothetical protein